MKSLATQHQRPPAPAEFAGKWVAWDREETRIIASGTSLPEVRAQARAQGETDPLFEKVPRLDAHFVGAA
jgi:hypothetical protein